jgi:hypothetical protein
VSGASSSFGFLVACTAHLTSRGVRSRPSATNRLGQPSMMGGQHRPAGGRIPQAVEDGHALGRPQDQVEGGHRIPTMGPAEEFAGCGVLALEHGLEPGHRCFALQPRAAAPYHRPGDSPWPTDTARRRWPAPGCNTPPGPSTAWRCRPPPRRFPPAGVGVSNAPVVHCSSDDRGSRVGRRANRQVLWRARCGGLFSAERDPCGVCMACLGESGG